MASRTIALTEPPSEAVKSRAVQTRLVANTVTVGALTCASKLTGAAKTIIIAKFFGASDALDAFLIAFLLPSFVADLIGGSLTPALVPLLVRAKAERGAEAGRRLAGLALSWASGVTLMLGAALALGGRWLLPLAGSSFSEEKLRLAELLFFVLLLWLPMGGCIAVWRAVLNAHQRFALAAIAPIASPALCIAFLYALTGRWGIGVLCAGTVAGVAIECLTLAVAVWRLGYPILPRWTNWRGADATQLGGQYLPLLASVAIGSACVLVDQSMAARLGPGQVSTLVYGSKLTAVTLQLVAMPIGVTILPTLARLAAGRDWWRLRRATLICCAAVTAIAVPLTASLVGGSGFLVRVFFERGAFHADAARMVAQVQRFSLLQVPFALPLALTTRLTSALSANALLARVGIVALAADVTLDYALSRWMGVAGIALASVFVQIVSLLVLMLLLYRREPRLFERKY
ncbi:MAG TPA: lipid II flippase MurJ [Bryobacteraceae bacterium]